MNQIQDEVYQALLAALAEFRNALRSPPAPDDEIRSWPLYIEDTGVYCMDDSCPLDAEGSQIASSFDSMTVTINSLYVAVGEHIAKRREWEEDNKEFEL